MTDVDLSEVARQFLPEVEQIEKGMEGTSRSFFVTSNRLVVIDHSGESIAVDSILFDCISGVRLDYTPREDPDGVKLGLGVALVLLALAFPVSAGLLESIETGIVVLGGLAIGTFGLILLVLAHDVDGPTTKISLYSTGDSSRSYTFNGDERNFAAYLSSTIE